MVAPPSTQLIVGTLFLGLLASLFWPLTRHLIVMVHEGSHATMGSVTGGRVTSVTMRANGTGLTKVLSPNRFLFFLIGYVGPSLFGIVGASVLAYGVPPVAVIWVSLALFVVLFLQVRNLFGWLAILIAGFFFFLVAWYGTREGRTVFAYTWIWFLLFGGFIHTVAHNVTMVGWSVDAGLLRDLTKLPRGLWGMLWWLATLAALVYGGGILLGAIDPLLLHRRV